MTVSDLGQAQETILVVGNVAECESFIPEFHQGSSWHWVSYADLDEGLLNRTRPDLVITPLISRQCDAVDVICRLSGFGYFGRFIALCKSLPDVDLVQAELSTRAPNIEATIVAIGE